MEKRGSIGIDIGGTKTLFALFDPEFEVLEEVKVKTQSEKGEAHFTEALTDSVATLISKAKKKKLSLASVGVGCAGCVDRTKGILTVSPNIPFLEDYSFASRLTKLTGAPVILLNDVQAGLYGEHQLGAAVGYKHVLGIFLGTGLGGALIIDGRPFLGAKGHAGNIGHYLLEALGPLAGSTRHGVLDDMVGRTAIAGAAASLAAKHLAPHLFESVGTEVSKIRSGELAEAIEKGDESIEELIRSRMRLLGIALSNLVDFLSPEMIVLGGGMTEAMPELVRQEVQMGIADHATARARDGLRIVVAKLGSHAVTTGAAKWAMDQHLATDPVRANRPAPRASKRRPGTQKSRSA